jgi:LysM repeat protein
VGLAKQYNTTPEAIREINGLKKNRITPGKHLLIPVDINGKAQDADLLAPGLAGKQQLILYRVKRGETLVKIAKEHNVSVADIRGWNKGVGKSVRAGQKIKLIVDVDQI